MQQTLKQPRRNEPRKKHPSESAKRQEKSAELLLFEFLPDEEISRPPQPMIYDGGLRTTRSYGVQQESLLPSLGNKHKIDFIQLPLLNHSSFILCTNTCTFLCALKRPVSNYALLIPNKGAKSRLRGIKQKKIQIIPLNLDLVLFLWSVKRNSKLAYFRSLKFDQKRIPLWRCSSEIRQVFLINLCSVRIFARK